MKTAIVTDSTAYLSQAECRKYHIRVVPIPVIIDGRSYNEGVDIDNQTFYRKLNVARQLPSTSQPPLGEMIKTYRNLAHAGYDTVISIHLASTISGLYKQLTQIAPAFRNIRVIPYDSKITVRLMGYLTMVAGKMALDHQPVERILRRLDDLRATINEVFVVDDLKNLVKGGRLSNASGLVGSLLRIKPLLTFDNRTDRIVVIDKIRSRRKALKKTEAVFSRAVQKARYPLRAVVINANDPAGGDAWTKQIQAEHPDLPVEQSYFGPVIGTHLGAKALALGWIKDFKRA